MGIKNAALGLVGLILGVFAGYLLRPAIADLMAVQARQPAPVKVTAVELANKIDDKDRELAKAVEGLSEAEIRDLLDQAVKLPESTARLSLLTNLYKAWARLNSSAAWKAVLEDKSNAALFNLRAVAGEIATKNPKTAVELAQGLGMGIRRSTAIGAILGEWAKTDTTGVLEYINQHPELPSGLFSLSSLIDKAVPNDSARVAALALNLKDKQARSGAITGIMIQWAALNPKSAWDWAQAVAAPDLRKSALAQVANVWADQDPQAAMAQVKAVTDPVIRAEAMQYAWNTWFMNDPVAAARFLSSVGDDKFIDGVGWRLIGSSNGFTQNETLSLIDTLPKGATQQKVLRAFADQQTRKGLYGDALQVLKKVAESDDRDRSLLELGRKWGETDLKAAEAWLKSQPDSSDRDLAVAGYATALAKTAPRTALQWAEAIPDNGVKLGALQNIALRWLKTDSASAEAWMASGTQWTELEKTRLRSGAKSYDPDVFSYPVKVQKRR